MAAFCFNQAKRRGIDVWYNAGNESPGRLKALLIRDGYAPTDPDADTVDGVFTTSPTGEVSVSGYARQTLLNVTRGVDDANNFAYLDADDLSFAGMTTGQDIAGVLLFEFVTNDADSIPIAWYPFQDVVDSGGTISVQFNTPQNGGVIKGA